jgi:hypothetical protein
VRLRLRDFAGEAAADGTEPVRSRLAASARSEAAVSAKRRASAWLVRIASSQTMPISTGTVASAAISSVRATGSSDANEPRTSHSMPATHVAAAMIASVAPIQRRC